MKPIMNGVITVNAINPNIAQKFIILEYECVLKLLNVNY